MRKGYPLAGKPLSLESFAVIPQLLISLIGDATDFVDEILVETGLKRRVAAPSIDDFQFIAYKSDTCTECPASVKTFTAKFLTMR